MLEGLKPSHHPPIPSGRATVSTSPWLASSTGSRLWHWLISEAISEKPWWLFTKIFITRVFSQSCISIGGDVTVLTKVKQTFKISVKTLSSKLHNKCHLQLIHSICHTFKMHPKSNIKTKLYSNWKSHSSFLFVLTLVKICLLYLFLLEQ